MLIFNGKPENFPVRSERFLAYIEDKNLNVESEKVSEANRDAIQRKLYQEVIMHLNDATLQMTIAQNNRNGFEIWKYSQKTFGQIRTSQIIVLWQEFLELKKNGELM